MSSYPDFSLQGYEIIRELGRNREGGRITWQASDLNTGQLVVLKQFCFAQIGSSWSAYNAYEREIQVLQGLNHPNIPRYLGAFSTADGFCLIQEYIHAPSLAVPRSYEPEEIKQIAVSALEILVYLQNRIPPIIHRDIKPENILVDEQLNVYLIDFGMSRIGSQEVAGSSVFKGTPGFIPPEQLRKPTEASDLYGLGATLICLLTATPSSAIVNLTDEDNPYLIRFRHLLPRLNQRFLYWLEKMVQPRLKDRFPSAEMALKALQQLEITLTTAKLLPITTLAPLENLDDCRRSRVEIHPTLLNFQATNPDEQLMQIVTVDDPDSETLLDCKWEVAPHPHDPPYAANNHAWISVKLARVNRNYAGWRVWVNTSKLMADQLYERHLLLRTNSCPETHRLTVRVQTAPTLMETQKLCYASIFWLFLTCNWAVLATTWVTNWAMKGLGNKAILLAAIAVTGTVYGRVKGAIGRACFLVGLLSFVVAGGKNWLMVAAVVLPVAWVVVLVTTVFSKVGQNCVDRGFSQELTGRLLLLTLGAGVSVGIGFIVGFLNPFVQLGVILSTLPMCFVLLNVYVEQLRLTAKYRKNEQRLIKP